ncbi:MAG: hypothetical protein E4H14_13290 [Candidatus Thorarchaeota archaeon]|nr:MAG: hypothetical protein E4H14_13290 [Candidatus Thorarchaeota archaeon]
MKQTFQDEVLSGNTESYKFFDTIKEEPPKQIIEFCQWVVSSYSYKTHTECVKGAFHLLAQLRDIASLQKLKELHGVWKNTYLSEYEYLLELLLNAEAGAICNCNVYQDGGFNVPPYQVDLEEIDRKFDDTQQTDIHTVKCKICGTEWEVEIDYSYHYPHSHWRKRTS